MNGISTSGTEHSAHPIALKIFGVGSAGIKVLEQISQRGLTGDSCVAAGTRAAALAGSAAAEKILLEPKPARRPGASGSPEAERALDEQNAARLMAACAGTEVIFIVAGLGGTTGTEFTPILARAARESGALVLAFVTLPFDCEGNRRRDHAERALAELKAHADGVVCVPNQKVFKLIDDTTSVVDTFKLMNELLAEGVSGLWRLLARKGLIEIHLTDLCDMLRGRDGESAFATAEASGPARSREAVDKLLAHPLLDAGKALAEADAVLVSIIGGPDLSMVEVNRIMENINGKCRHGQVMMGAAIDESFHERLTIALIALRRNASPISQLDAEDYAPAEVVRGGASLESQLLDRTPGARRQSRFVPPPPSLSPEKMEQLMAKQGTGRPRKTSPRMRQGQLPLSIISKGRFDKSEPTIHKGEDLDVPTYIRRGVALN